MYSCNCVNRVGSFSMCLLFSSKRVTIFHRSWNKTEHRCAESPMSSNSTLLFLSFGIVLSLVPRKRKGFKNRMRNTTWLVSLWPISSQTFIKLSRSVLRHMLSVCFRKLKASIVSTGLWLLAEVPTKDSQSLEGRWLSN